MNPTSKETFTAYEIYKKFVALTKEKDELAQAKDVLYNEQAGSIAHNLVRDAYDEKVKELNAYRITKFEVSEAKGFEF